MQTATQKVSIVGFGNVGFHLTKHLHDAGIDVTHVLGKRNNQSEHLCATVEAELVQDIAQLPGAQLTILCVPDDQIEGLVKELNNRVPVAYTSGAVDLHSLGDFTKNLGVFYPLQTFTRTREIDLSNVPFFIEATNKAFEENLVALASAISHHVTLANSEQRKEIHLTAVWVNNFTNHILHIAKTYAQKHNLNFDHFKPLLQETIAKVDKITPYEAQTGPARRGDEKTIAEHLRKLEGTDKELYELLTKSIRDTYEKL